MGYDIVWWGIIKLCVVETGLIHPPLGLNVFVLKSVSPTSRSGRSTKASSPSSFADLVKLVLLLVFPAIALWLVTSMGT